MTEISAKVFRQQYASLKRSDPLIPAKQLDHALETALSAQTFTEKAAKLKTSITYFLQTELEPLETEKLVKSSTVALLCKYHLITGNSANHDLSQPEYFQVKEPPLKKTNP